MAMVPQLDAQRKDGSLVALGQYEILREIASGGMATVYLGQKRGIGGFERLVAIKCCHPHLRRDPAFVTMFLDEARLAAKIHHPNVVGTLDIGDDEALYFVMQYVQGSNLAEWIQHASALDQRIDEGLLLRVMLDGLNGLHAAHELRDDSGKLLNLIHRDISPHNLLIGIDGVTRIADFGIAKAETRATRTRTGQVKGKTGYMSPEQILGEPMDRRADIYAGGVVLWEALTGKRLFDAESDAAIINQVLNARVPAPSTVSDASACLDAVVSRALRFNPDERYSTALEFAQALEQSGIAAAAAQAVGDAIGAWIGEQAANGNESPPFEVRAAAGQPLPEAQAAEVQPLQRHEAPAASTKGHLRSGLATGARRGTLLVAGLMVLALVGLWIRSHFLRAEPEVARAAPQPSIAATIVANNPPLTVAAAAISANIAPSSQPPEAKAPRPKTTAANAMRVHVESGAKSNSANTSTPAPASTIAAFTPSAAASAGKLSSPSAATAASIAPASPTHSKAKPSEFRPPDL
jgi:eukaryotic-like serine/threonine-protein kinase